jgi:hypothetical protein
MALPMLDEEEFSVVSSLYSQGMKATKEFREKAQHSFEWNHDDGTAWSIVVWPCCQQCCSSEAVTLVIA